MNEEKTVKKINPKIDKSNERRTKLPLVQRISAILWPSFITAAIANVLFFIFIDPDALLYASGIEEMDAIAIYSKGFLLFWALTSSSCILTSYFMKPCSTIK